MGITDNTINNKCSKCGNCCGIFIPMIDEEIENLKKYVKENNIQPEKRFDGNNLEIRCPFLDLEKKKCKVYEVRPFVCRDFICNRKDWKKYRDNYMKRSKYNNYTMDELIYNDITMHVMILVETAKKIYNTKELTLEQVENVFKLAGRKDLLKRVKFK